MRRKDKEIKEPIIIEEILRDNTVCRIALSENNVPYIVPMNYGYDGKAIYLHSAAEGKKIDILRKNDRVCFEIEDSIELKTSTEACSFSTKYRSIIGVGTATEILQTADKIAGMQSIMYQQTGSKDWPFPEEQLKNIIVLKISINSISGKESN